MSEQQACRERGTELYEIFESLKRNGNQLESLLIRLTTIGNRLLDESGDLKLAPKQEEKISNKIMLPGAITDINRCINGTLDLINSIEVQIQKLEKII